MRTALQEFDLNPGWDLIISARPGLDEAPWDDLTGAIGNLLKQAGAIG
jgi:RNase P protein component